MKMNFYGLMFVSPATRTLRTQLALTRCSYLHYLLTASSGFVLLARNCLG